MIRVRKNKMAHFFGRSHQIPQPFFVPEAVAYKALKANMTHQFHIKNKQLEVEDEISPSELGRLGTLAAAGSLLRDGQPDSLLGDDGRACLAGSSSATPPRRGRWAWQPERPIQRPPTPHALPSVILLRDARINSSSNPALLLSKVLRADPTRPYILFTFENNLFTMLILLSFIQNQFLIMYLSTYANWFVCNI